MASCPRCHTNALMSAGLRGVIVRDCLAYCSACGVMIESIDYVHTCLGGELCTACYARRKSNVPTLSDLPPSL